MQLKETLESRRVFVSGRGVVFSQGLDLDALWKSVAADKMIHPIPFSSEELRSAAGISESDFRILDRHQALALCAVQSAWKEARLPQRFNSLRGQGQKHRAPDFGCLGGSSLGGLSAFDQESGLKPHPFSLARWRGNSVAAAVSLRFGLGGCSLALSAASASGSQALWMAGFLIRSGVINQAVVVFSDSKPSDRIMRAMRRTGSVSVDVTGRPLSHQRLGMIPREGAAAIILEADRSLVDRGGVPVCEWLGGESQTEAFHLIAPERSGRVLESLLRSAKQTLGTSCRPWISLHATGTRIFDAIELQVIKKVFAGESPWIMAVKRTMGHTLGAAGVLDAAFISEGLYRGQWPSWPSDMDPLIAFPNGPSLSASPPEKCIQIGQGMGGVVTINLWGRCQ